MVRTGEHIYVSIVDNNDVVDDITENVEIIDKLKLLFCHSYLQFFLIKNIFFLIFQKIKNK